MEQMTMHIGIEPGRGLVGRFGDTIVLIPPGTASGGDEAARELLGLAAGVASDRQRPATVIAARVAAWVIGRMPQDDTAFGIASPVAEGVVVFLRGAVRCTVTEGGSTRELSGEQAVTWVDQIVPGSFDRLAIGGTAGQPVQAHPVSDLRDGVVPGQGFVLTWVGAARAPGSAAADPGPAARAQPAAEASAAAASAAAAAAGPQDAGPRDAAGLEDAPGPEDAGEAVPSGAPPAGVSPAGDRQPTMKVESEPRPEPAGRAPSVAETLVAPIPDAARVRPSRGTEAAGAPLGLLRSESGLVIIMDRAYVLGREPQHDSLVKSGAAAPVVIQDPDSVISRVHAYVSVERGAVLIRDAGSSHGTYISAPGADQWTRVGAEPSQLHPGWGLRIGREVFVFQPSGPPDAR